MYHINYRNSRFVLVANAAEIDINYLKVVSQPDYITYHSYDIDEDSDTQD